jgi:hypothetical protein
MRFSQSAANMRDSRMDAYTVRPRDTKDGYKLEGQRLSHGRLLYRYQEDAISYAKWNSRANGCKIDILCDQDKVVRTEEFSPEIVWL